MIRGVALLSATGALLGSCRPAAEFAQLEIGPRAATLQDRVASETLPNGLRVAVLPDARTNLVTVEVRYDVGGADDPDDAGGLAHFAEHLLFDAGLRTGSGEAVADVALAANATTELDRTRFFATALDVDLDRELEVAARRLEATCDDLPPAILARERDVVRAEHRLRGASAWTDTSILAAVWGTGHPYTHPVVDEGFAAASPEAVCAFLAQHYGPASASLVVAGNVDAAVLARIRARFGAIAARPQATRWSHSTAVTDDVRLTVPGLDRPTAMLVFPVPGEGDALEPAVQLLGGITWPLRGGGRARVAHTLTLGQERARVLAVVVEVDEPEELPAAAEALRAAFAQPALPGFAEQQQRARTALVARFDDLVAAGLRLTDLLARGQPLARYGDLRALDDLTAADALRVLDASAAHLVLLVPDRAATRGHEVAELQANLHQVDVTHSRETVDTTPPPLPAVRVARPLVEAHLANGLRVWFAPDPGAVSLDARLVASTSEVAGEDRQLALEAGLLLEAPDPAGYAGDAAERVRWYGSIGVPVGRTVAAATTTFAVVGFALFGDWHVWNLAWTVLHGGYPGWIDDAHGMIAASGAEAEPPSALAAVATRLAGHRDDEPRERWRLYTRAELDAFRRRAYQPERSTLIVSGRFDLPAMHAEVARLFSGWREAVAPRAPSQPPPSHAPRVPSFAAIPVEDAATVDLAIAFAPEAGSPDAEAAARAVLSEILADRLRVVREGLGVSYGVHAGVGPKAVVIAGSVTPAFAATAARAILAEVARVRDGDAAFVADFVRARKVVLARAIAEPVGATPRANELERLAIEHAPLDQTERDIEAIRTLDLEAVRRLAARDLRPERMIAALRGPDAAIAPAFVALGATGVRIERLEAPAAAR